MDKKNFRPISQKRWKLWHAYFPVIIAVTVILEQGWIDTLCNKMTLLISWVANFKAGGHKMT